MNGSGSLPNSNSTHASALLEATLDTIVEKQDIVEQTYSHLEELEAGVSALLDTLTADMLTETTEQEPLSPAVVKDIQALNRLVQECNIADKFTKGQSELHLSLNKFARDISKLLETNSSQVDKSSVELVVDDLMPLIVEHLVSEGYVETASALDSSIPKQLAETIAHFNELSKQVKQRQPLDALAWCKERLEEAPTEDLSQIVLQLHMIHFYNLLGQGQSEAALAWAQQHLGPYEHTKQVHQMMGAMAFAPHFESSPYNQMINADFLQNLLAALQRQYCISIAIAPESRLYVLYMAGLNAIPSLVKANALISTWDGVEKVGVEIPLPSKYVYHSIFCCPVTKELATKANPPMLLPCGHVIAKETAHSLASIRARFNQDAKFKCPYCPTKILMSEIKEIFF